MRPLFRVAAAAALLVAALLGLVFTRGGSVALADVVKAAEKHRLVRFKMHETIESNDEPKTAEGVYVGYADLRAPRFRQDFRATTVNGKVEHVSFSVQDNRKNRMLHVLTETVVEGAENSEDLKPFADRFPRKEASLRTVPDQPQINRNHTFLDNLRELEKHKDAKAAKDTINGRPALKYDLRDGSKTTQLWVDVETRLPVQLDVEMHFTEGRTSKLVQRMSDLEWDPQLKGYRSLDELFSVTPPEGHKLTDETNESK